MQEEDSRAALLTRLLIKCHNLYMAEPDFAKEEMDGHRRSADRVGEPVPSFELSLGRVETG